MGLFTSDIKGEGFKAIPDTPEQTAARNYLNTLYSTPVSYPTQQIEGISGNEQVGQDMLSRFLAEGPSEERGTALSFLTGLLDQPDDIMELPEIKALMAGITDQTSDLVNTSMRRTQLQGMGTSGPQGSAVGRELAKGQTSMVAALAPYLSQARSNQLTASQLINSLVSGEEGSTLGKIGASQTYGALPRQLNQAEKDAAYNKTVNDILAKYQLQMPAASSVLNEQRYMYNPGTVEPSVFDRFAPAIGPAIGLGLGSGAAFALCDERMKENFAPIDDALVKLGKLNGKTYNYISRQPGDRDAGIIAQDLQAVLPEGVIEKDGVKFVKLEAVVALLVNAVNELSESVKRKTG